MCQTGSRKIAADGIDIDQLHYLNAECHFWVLIYTSMIHIIAIQINVVAMDQGFGEQAVEHQPVGRHQSTDAPVQYDAII